MQSQAMPHDGEHHDSVFHLPPIRFVEQSPDMANEERRDSVFQMPLLRHDKSPLSITQDSKRHDKLFQEMLDEHHAAVDRRKKVSIDDLVTTPTARPLAKTTKTKRVPSTSKTMQGSPTRPPARKNDSMAAAKVRAIHRAFPRPKLQARPPSTETLAPGTHLFVDSKRWASRSRIDRHFIKRLAANDIGSFRPAPAILAPSLLMLLRAVTAMTTQNREARRRGKGR